MTQKLKAESQPQSPCWTTAQGSSGGGQLPQLGPSILRPSAVASSGGELTSQPTGRQLCLQGGSSLEEDSTSFSPRCTGPGGAPGETFPGRKAGYGVTSAPLAACVGELEQGGSPGEGRQPLLSSTHPCTCAHAHTHTHSLWSQDRAAALQVLRPLSLEVCKHLVIILH